MAKIRIYELAKKIGKDNNDILKFLGEKGIEGKSHMSGLDEKDTLVLHSSYTCCKTFFLYCLMHLRRKRNRRKKSYERLR